MKTNILIFVIPSEDPEYNKKYAEYYADLSGAGIPKGSLIAIRSIEVGDLKKVKNKIKSVIGIK